MSSPTPKAPNYMSDKRSISYGSPLVRQPTWDSVHTLTDSMSKMTVRNQSTPATNSNTTKHRRDSASDSSSSSAPVVTPVPSKDVDSANVHPTSAYSGTPQPPQGYQYRGPNAPVTIGKPDEVLQVDYNLQPRHFIPSSITSPQPGNTGPANGTRPNAGANGAAAPFVPQSAFSPNATGNNAFYGQPPSGYPAQGGGAADNKATQDIAAQIALNNALQGLNAPIQGQTNAGLNPALAAAAYGNPNLIPGLYGNSLYGTGVNGAVPGAQGFYPGQENMAAAVANAVAQLPPAAFHAALQNVGLAAYPLNGLPGAVPGMNVGMGGVPGMGVGPGGMLGAQGGPSANNRKLGLYKTELCRSWEEKGTCRYGPKCQFAHGEEELKRVQRHPKYKTEICRTFWLSGSCPYGKRCCFIHTELPNGENGEKKDGQDGPQDPNRGWEEALQRERERERAQNANSDSEQQQTSMLARIRREPTNASGGGGNTPSPPMLNQAQGINVHGHPGVNGHGNIGGPTTPGNMAPGSGRPTLAALRVDTKSINDTTVPKNSYPYTSNPAMPAPGLTLATDVIRGRLSPVPATAGADFGRHAAARMEVVGVSPQSGRQTPQPGGGGRHLRSVSQTFPSSVTSAIEPSGNGRASPAGNLHTRADSWGANTLIAPASAVEPSGRYMERKW